MSIRSKISSAASKVKSVAKSVVSKASNVASSIGSSFKKVAQSGTASVINAVTPPKVTGPIRTNAPIRTNKPLVTGPIRTEKPTSVAGSSMSSKSRPGSSALTITGNYDGSSFSDPFSSYSGSELFQQVPTSLTVNSANLGIGTTTTIAPSTPSVKSYEGDIQGGNVGLGADAQTGYFTPQTEGEEAPPAGASDPMKTYQDYVKSLKEPESEADLYNRALRDSGFEEAQQRLNNVQGLINTRTAKMNTDLLQLRGVAGKEGVTEAVYGGQQAQISREAAIDLLPMQAQLAVEQGNMEMASERLNTLFSIYTKDAQRSVDFYNDNVKGLYNVLTEQEKAKVAAQSEKKKDLLARTKDITDFQQSVLLKGLGDGNQALINSMKGIRPPTNMNSPTIEKDLEDYYTDVISMAGRYGASAMSSLGGVGRASAAGNVSSLAGAVIENPSLFYNFTPTQKAAIVSELRNQGYDISGLQNTKLSTGQQDELAQMNTVMSSIDKVLSFNSDGQLEGIGAYTGLFKQFGAQIGIGSEEGKTVRAEIGNIKGTIAKIRGGTSFTANEERLLNTYTPSINDAPAVAINKLQNLKDFITRKNSDLLGAAKLNVTAGQIKKGKGSVSNIRTKYNLTY